MSNNNDLEANIGNFLDKVDAAKGLLLDLLNEVPAGTTPTGMFGVAGAILQIDSALNKYNESEKTPEDFGRLSVELTSNVPGLIGIYFGTLLITHDLSKTHHLGRIIYKILHPEYATKTHFDQAKNFVPRRDPLTFDLDGDGIETVAASISNPILFDHDGDGIKNGTGWVNQDDAFLVLDKNANGTIDNGNELFGDSTIKSNGQKAVDGFDALADLDSNNDGVVNAQDSQFANLRLWRDLNQDGISQVNELFTLDSQNIAGINVASTEHSQVLANGNELADKGTFIKSDGSTGSFGEVTGHIGDVNLADDTFNREFPDHLDISDLSDLPDMQGSGKVRDLLEAATQSSRLQSLLQDFSAANTRAGQIAIIDNLLDAWADTSGMAENLDDRVEGLMYEAWTIDAQGNPVRNSMGDLPYSVIYQSFGSTQRQYINPALQGYGNTIIPPPDLENDNLTAEYKSLIASWQQKLHILEVFNGSYFFGIPSSTQPEGAKTGLTIQASSGQQSGGTTGGLITNVPLIINFTQQQLDFLNNSYVYLKESVFNALTLQTRYKPVLDLILMEIDESGISLDFADVEQYFQAKTTQSITAGIADLLEFNQVTSSLLSNTGWSGNQIAAEYIRNATITSELQDVLNTFRVKFASLSSVNGTAFDDFILGDQNGNNISGGDGSDRLLAGDGNDTVYGGEGQDSLYGELGNDSLIGNQGNDYLDGGDGNDILYGDDGTDTIIGGAGNDIIYASGTNVSMAIGSNTADDITGGLGNDGIYGTGGANIYRYNLGDGTDSIEASGRSDYYVYPETATLDTLFLGAGISQGDVTFTKSSNDFIINFSNAGDKITFRNWYSYAGSRLASIQFADGSTMGASDFLKLQGTSGNDSIIGSSDNDLIYGLDGNDSLYGSQGNDYLDGADGNDTLYGDDGTDVLVGGAGNDFIFGHNTSSISTEINTADDITGGLGNDSIYGTGGANIYRYNLGDGSDSIEASGRQDWSVPATTTLDTLILGAGISQGDVTFSKSSNDFIINFSNAGDKITLRNWYSYAGSRLASIQFADGSTMGASDFLKLQGTSGNDSITGSSDNDLIYGLDGNDSLYGSYGNDYIEGGEGADWLYGDEGTDVLIGGTGNDIIFGHNTSSISTEINTADDITGGLGNDSIYGTGGANIYRYNLGDGTDTVEASGRQDWSVPATTTLDTLVLGVGITRTDVTFSKVNNDFVINFSNAGDKITFRNWYSYAGSRLASIQFADGSTMGASDFLKLQGTSGNDSITGSSDNDLIYGLDGSDSLYGSQGNDYIEGGDGADWLYGDEGTDVLIGGTGNDIIFGHNTSSISTEINTADDITGGLGNDSIYGTGGANIYRYNLGDGTDTIEASGRQDWSVPAITTLDTLILGAGILRTDVTFNKLNNDFVVNFSNAGDKITFRNWYSYAGSRLASIQFADGSIMDASDLLAIKGTANNDSLTGTSDNDLMYGLGGNDILYAGLGNDYLDGGDGNDTLYGDEGTDTIVGGTGNDIIYASGTNASIATGSNTADDITGGLGNDTIYGTGGANIYRYNLGDGSDSIEASGRTDYYVYPVTATLDTLILGAGISQGDVTFTKSSNDFIINFSNAGDKITFKNWYAYTSNRLVNIQFADGSTKGASDFMTLHGNSGNDSITGSSDNDLIYGLDGNDSLYGSYGNDYIEGGEGSDWLYGDEGTDVLIGGAGNDIIFGHNTSSISTEINTADDITGGLGNDSIYGTGGANIYRYNLGDGTDTIEASGRQDWSVPATTTLDTLVLGVGITRTDVTFSKVNNDFVINFSNAGDKITFRNWYSYAGSRLANVQFADGSTMGASDFLKLQGTSGNDSITGTAENDQIYGLDGSDSLYGNQGDDYIEGGDGNDNLYGNEGTDILIGGAGNDVIYADTNDSISTSRNTADDITGGLGNDTIYGSGGTNIYRYNLGDGTDTIEASGYQGWSQSATNTLDTLILGAGISRADVTFSKSAGTNDFIINFANPGDKITLRNWYSYAASRLASIQFADGVSYSFVQGNNGASQNDIIAGGSTAVAESMSGGAGDDIYIVDHISDVVTEGAGEGDDRVISSITYTLSNNVEAIQLVGTTNINATGNSLSNLLIGNSGNNILDGQSGADVMQGGLGDDTYIADTELDQVTEQANSGNDTVKITYSNNGSVIDLTADVGQFLNIENITVQSTGLFNLYGSAANNSLAGNGSSNLIVGFDGDDVLDGGLGSDILIGGTGNDQYYVDAAGDVVTELENEGVDTVNSSITYSISDKANIENITLIGNAVIHATGNDTDNVITGNTAVNQLAGGKGNDTYVVAATDDVITELANEGVDTVASSVSFSLANIANVENLTLTGSSSISGTGNALNNTILGNIGSNVINGGSGDDLMVGGLGSDTYYVDSFGDQIIENFNEGSDTVNVSITAANNSYTLGTNLENAILANTVAFTLIGNELNNSLSGNASANTLIGGAGNDTLNGGAGADILIGGSGDDIYFVDNVSDTVDEALNEGVDVVYVSIASAGLTYAVANNIENVTLQNGVAFNITGNDLNNILIGNSAANTLNGGSGNDTLNGGAGNDILIGGAGDDIYHVDSLADVVTELSNEGVDTINVNIATGNGSYSLGENIENAIIISTQNYSLVGNASNNSLTGNSWNNTLNGGLGDDLLNGGSGVDILVGGDGNDIYLVDTTTDTITELAGGGTDTVQSSVSFVLATSSNLENLALTGTSSINGTGNELTNFLLGNAGSNTLTDTAGGNDILQGLAGNDTLNDTSGSNLLDGGAGADTITAGGGNDVIIGGRDNDTITSGTGADVILFNKGDGADIVNASVGTDNTLSLGGNLAYGDLSLSKTTNDLILKVGASDQITFKGWYDTTANNKSVLNLQVIAEAVQGFSLGGSDILRNDRVETFNFANLVAAFDTAGATANWQLTDARLSAHLASGSDSAAIGGDIAYQYGKNGSLVDVGLLASQSVINNASVGQSAQTLNTSSSWASENIKLS